MKTFCSVLTMISVLVLAFSSAGAEGFHVVSVYDEVDGYYEPCCHVRTAATEGLYSHTWKTVYRKVDSNYYLGYRGRATDKWVILELSAEPTSVTIADGNGEGRIFVNATDSPTPPLTGWASANNSGEPPERLVRSYRLDTPIGGEGTVVREPSKLFYHSGATVTLTAIPASDAWELGGWGCWDCEFGIKENPITLTMDGDWEIKTGFIEKSRTSARYRVVSEAPEVAGIYAYCCDIRPESSDGVFTSAEMPTFHKTGTSYYIGYKGCSAKWVIMSLADPPVRGSFSDRPVDGFLYRNLTDSPAPPHTGWGAGSGEQCRPGPPTERVYRVFELDVRTLGSGDVTINPGLDYYEHGATVILTAEPRLGWEFTGWSGAVQRAEHTASVVMDADKQVVATFAGLGDCDLLLTVEGSGQVLLDPPGGSYDNGDVVTLTALVENAYWQFTGWQGEVTGQAETATLTMDGDKNVTATFTLIDSDGDGLSDRNEDQGANGGDGNRDGTPDRLQANVIQVSGLNGQPAVTLASAAGTSLRNYQCTGNPHPDTCPEWASFPYGFFRFSIAGVTPGGETTLDLILPDIAGAEIPTSYYKYGPLPADPTAQWYRFKYEDTTLVGARMNGRTITLHFVDGRMGDDDLDANGVITDIGGPAVLTGAGIPPAGRPNGATTTGDSGGGGGGGCLLSTLAGGKRQNR